jgi:hypothetical protein
MSLTHFKHKDWLIVNMVRDLNLLPLLFHSHSVPEENQRMLAAVSVRPPYFSWHIQFLWARIREREPFIRQLARSNRWRWKKNTSNEANAGSQTS